MAVQGITPFIHVSDSNGNPYVGANLYVYTAGTTTLKAIYSDDALSVAIANPLTSDSAGKFARFYMAAGTYKLKATTLAGVEIWTYDNLDTGLSAGSGALPITGGGTGATTAAAARANLDVPANSEITSLSSSITDLQTTIQNIVSVPQGRLTPTSGSPTISSDVTAGTAVYYAPYIGNLCPIYDGSQFNATSFAELTLTLSSNHTASSIYDCFVINDSGTVRIVTGPSWNTVTAGSCARGSGAGTTELSRQNGLLTNTNSMTARNGATTYTVAANRGTYVGSIFMDGTNGQITCHVTGGVSRKFSVWNAYNQQEIILQVSDPTASWTYTSTTVRPSNNSATNVATSFCGLADQFVKCRFVQNANPTTNTSNSQVAGNGVGWNSTSGVSGKSGAFGLAAAAAAANGRGDMSAIYNAPPSLGINNVTALEYLISSSGGVSATYYGTNSYMLMEVIFKG